MIKLFLIMELEQTLIFVFLYDCSSPTVESPCGQAMNGHINAVNIKIQETTCIQ